MDSRCIPLWGINLLGSYSYHQKEELLKVFLNDKYHKSHSPQRNLAEHLGQWPRRQWCLSLGSRVPLTHLYSLSWADEAGAQEEAPSLQTGFPVAQWIHLPMQEAQLPSLGWEEPLEEEMATHCSILAWRIPWTEESGGLQSMGSQRVTHNWECTHCKQYIQYIPFLIRAWVLR